MSKIIIGRDNRLVDRKLRRLHADLLSFGVSNTDIAEWCGCTSQNISQRWKTGGFTGRQIIIMQDRLEALKEQEDRNV